MLRALAYYGSFGFSTAAQLRWQPFINLTTDRQSHAPAETNADRYPLLLLNPPDSLPRAQQIRVGGRIDLDLLRSPLEFGRPTFLSKGFSVPPVVQIGLRVPILGHWHDWHLLRYDPVTQQFLSRGFRDPVVVPTGSARLLMAQVVESQESPGRSVFLSRSRGEDRYLHRLCIADYSRHETPESRFSQFFLRKGCGEDRLIRRITIADYSRHETPEPRFSQFFLRKGVGEDPYLHRLRIADYSRHETPEQHLSQFFLRKGVGEDRGLRSLLVHSWSESPTAEQIRGRFLSSGSFVALVPQDRVQLMLTGVAHDAFIPEDIAVFFPSKFIHVGSDFVPPVVPASPVIWHFLARRRGRWGR